MRAHTITTTRPAVLLSLLALGALGLLVGGGGGQSAAAIPAATGAQATATLETTITKPKGNIATRRQTVTFEFTANQPGATFECAVDPARPGHQYHQPFHPCTSPFRVRGIGYHPPRKHAFEVRATVGGVTENPPARVKWYRVG
jgi:hypothetical protein